MTGPVKIAPSRAGPALAARASSPSAGELSLLEHVYRDNYAALKRQLTSRLRCEATAADIAHTAFVKLAEHKAPENIRDPQRFLFRIALNLAGSHGRATSRRARLLADHHAAAGSAPSPATPERDAICREDLALAARAIEKMPKKRRQAVVLFLYHGLAAAEIAAALGVTPQAARQHVSRGLAACRDAIEDAAGKNAGHKNAGNADAGKKKTHGQGRR